jgi:hypothetical protein
MLMLRQSYHGTVGRVASQAARILGFTLSVGIFALSLARATLECPEGNPEVERMCRDALDVIRRSSPEGYEIITELEASSHRHMIFTSDEPGVPGSFTPFSARDAFDEDSVISFPDSGVAFQGTGKGSAGWIDWNPNDFSTDVGGVTNHPTSTLGHELHHALDAQRGESSLEVVPGTETPLGGGIKTDEIDAAQFENEVRDAIGEPRRKTYGGVPVPQPPGPIE